MPTLQMVCPETSLVSLVPPVKSQKVQLAQSPTLYKARISNENDTLVLGLRFNPDDPAEYLVVKASCKGRYVGKDFCWYGTTTFRHRRCRVELIYAHSSLRPDHPSQVRLGP